MPYDNKNNLYDSGYCYAPYLELDSDMPNNVVAISAKKQELSTPYADQFTTLAEKLADKIEAKIEKEVQENPFGLFCKLALCLVTCVRILLGNDDEDVREIQRLMLDKKFRNGIQKEVEANPREVMGMPAERQPKPARLSVVDHK